MGGSKRARMTGATGDALVLPCRPTFLLATGYINLCPLLLISFGWKPLTLDIEHRIPIRTFGKNVANGCTQALVMVDEGFVETNALA